MKLLQQSLNTILNFQFQLVNDIWIKNDKTNEIEHKSFQILIDTHKRFKNSAMFIFRSMNSIYFK